MELSMKLKEKSPLKWLTYTAIYAVIEEIMEAAHGDNIAPCQNPDQNISLEDDVLTYKGARSAFVADGSRGVFQLFGDGTPIGYETSIFGLEWNERVEDWLNRQESAQRLEEFVARTHSGVKFTLEPSDGDDPAEWTGVDPDGVASFLTHAVETALGRIHTITGETVVMVGEN